VVLPLAPDLLGPTSRVRVASTVSPSFFFSAPEMAPRMVCFCHPRRLGDLLHGGAFGALEHLDHLGLLGAGARGGLLGRRGLA
jgi:hypothetical protein